MRRETLEAIIDVAMFIIGVLMLLALFVYTCCLFLV